MWPRGGKLERVKLKTIFNRPVTIKYVNAGTETSHQNIAGTNFRRKKKTINTCKPSKTFNVNARFGKS